MSWAYAAAGAVLGAVLTVAAYHLCRSSETAVTMALTRERRRIAREVHDVVGHALVMITMLVRELAQAAPRTRGTAELIEETVHQTLHDVRRLIGVLRRTDELRPRGDRSSHRRRRGLRRRVGDRETGSSYGIDDHAP